MFFFLIDEHSLGRNCWKLFGNAMYDSDGDDLGEENAYFEPLGQPYVEDAFSEF